MRIFGGSDYYSSCLSHGIDPSITLTLYKEKGLPDKYLPKDLFRANDLVIDGWMASLNHYHIIFCGREYYGVRYSSSLRFGKKDYSPDENIWGYKRLQEVLAITGDKVTTYRDWSSKYDPNPENAFRVRELSEDQKQFMIDNKFSIILRNNKSIQTKQSYINPIGLGTIGFAKALDPYTAFQELSMWIGGILGGNSPETVAITDDKVLAQSHGFDKESFRGPRIK